MNNSCPETTPTSFCLSFRSLCQRISRTFSGQLVSPDPFPLGFTLLHLDNYFNHKTSLYANTGSTRSHDSMAELSIMICFLLIVSSEGCQWQLHHSDGATRQQVANSTPEGPNLTEDWLSPEMKTVTVSVIPVGISRDTVLQACGAGAEQDLGRWRGQAQGVQNTMQSWHLLGYPNSHPRTSSARQRYSTANLNYEPGLKGCTRIHHGKLHQDKPYEKTRFMEFIGPPLSRPIVISLESNHICLT